MNEKVRTSLLFRCSSEDAEKIRTESSAQRRSVSGYLLSVLDQSIWIENKYPANFLHVRQAPILASSESRTAIHLRCTAEEAHHIREAAKRRLRSISGFVVFSLHRHWRAAEHANRKMPVEGGCTVAAVVTTWQLLN
jgi:hypothetical protein